MSVQEEMIGPYRLVKLLGRGTMASVYLGERDGDGNDVAAQVAVKRLHAVAGDDDRERLRREGETMAALDHPHILRVLDVVVDGDGIALILPYAPNGSLAQNLAQHGPVTAKSLLGIVSPLADALSTAHRHGILHRDVKPSNILFTANDVPMLADFGIASNSAHTNLTRTDVAMGTAAYLDPDLADGGEPSAFSDQYALGVVAYEAIHGRTPFTGPTPLAVLRAADRALISDPGSSGNETLDAVVRKAFARHRDDRWPSIDAFADALKGAVAVGPRRLGESRSPHTSEPDGASDETRGTTTFRRPRQPSSASVPAPTHKPTKTRSRLVLAGIGTAAAIVAGAVGVKLTRTSGLRDLGIPALPRCTAETNAQCVTKSARTATGIQVEFANGLSGEYTVGQSTDSIRLGNFFCGERATMALYEQATGRIFYLSNWPDPKRNEPSAALVDETGLTRAEQVSVGDRNSDGCADLAIDVNGARTWFEPVAQERRLAPVDLEIKFKESS